MTNYRRYRVEGGTFFFTVVLLDRRSSLLTTQIQNLREAFRTVKTHHPFDIDAMVVLPDHLHCILTLPPGDADFSLRWRQIKSAFSRGIPNGEGRSQSRINKNERGIWQRRFWEHHIRDERDFRHRVDYIHFNPVKHGLVDWVSQWPYSTFHQYVECGVYGVDWGGGGMEVVAESGEPT
jgi:putative transposase